MKFNIYIFIISRVGATMVFAPFRRLCRQLTVVGKPSLDMNQKAMAHLPQQLLVIIIYLKIFLKQENYDYQSE